METMIRKPGAMRREEIAKAVLRIIGQRGLTKLTTTTIAAEVGITSGGLFRHFASRQEILSEAVRYGIAKIEATFPRTPFPRQSVSANWRDGEFMSSPRSLA